MRFRQVLVTRFNNVLDQFNTKALNDEWLRYRWRIFTGYTHKTINNQSSRSFDWFVLCHPESPDWLKQEARALGSRVPTHFIFGDDPAVRDLISEAGELDAVLTTRLDSDDGLHKDAMLRIGQYFEQCPELYDVLNFECGYQYDVSSQRLGFNRLPSPPFATMIHRRPIEDPFFHGHEHHDLPRHWRYRDISFGDPLFLQIIHGDNLINAFNYGGVIFDKPLSRHVLRECFAIEDAPKRTSPKAYLVNLRNLLWQIRKT